MTEVWRFYERFANEWDRDRSKPGQGLMERRYLDEIASRLSPRAEILDLGCGTGEPIARYLTDRGFKVTGVDAAPAMIAICRQRFPEGTWLEADMRTLALDRRYDAIIAWDSIFHLDQGEQRAMLPILRRHIAPEGLLLFTSGPEAATAIGTMYGEELFHASLDPDKYRRLLARSGFQVLLYRPEDPDCGKHTIWLARAEG
jgi:2-polyprenyl-3-methyl-5-hydroxy-6-metoxy-1,4-benzoquinol methylase